MLYLIERHGIKLILAFKIAVIGYIFYDQGYIISERSLSAQDQNQATKQNQTPETSLKGKSNPDQKLAEVDEDVVVKRRSYIEDLLNLPKIDKSEIKKGEISQFLILIDKKLQQVKDRTAILDQRENHLKGLEGTIDEKLKKLDDEITYFKQTLQKEKEINEQRLNRLVEFYEKMTPKKAAPVFENMDRDLVVALFQRIPKKQTMNILSLMPPDKSIVLTEYFGRIRSGKEYEMLKEINSSLRREFQDCKGLPEEAQ